MRIRREPDGPDRAGAEMLVAIEPRAELGLRIVEVDHRQAIEPDPLVEVGHEAIDAVGRVDRVAGAPQVGRVEAERDSSGGDARGRRSRRAAPPAR